MLFHSPLCSFTDERTTTPVRKVTTREKGTTQRERDQRNTKRHGASPHTKRAAPGATQHRTDDHNREGARQRKTGGTSQQRKGGRNITAQKGMDTRGTEASAKDGIGHGKDEGKKQTLHATKYRTETTGTLHATHFKVLSTHPQLSNPCYAVPPTSMVSLSPGCHSVIVICDKFGSGRFGT